MSYRMEPIFNCAICGEMATAAAWESMPFGYKVLPSGWVGSTRKNGICYCERCAAAIRELVDADAEVEVDE